MCVLTKDVITEMGVYGVWGVLVWGVCKEVYGMNVLKTEGTPTWEYLPMKLCLPPTIIVGGLICPCRGRSKAGIELESWCVLQNLVTYV